MEDEYKLVKDLSNGAIFNELDWTLTKFAGYVYLSLTRISHAQRFFHEPIHAS